MLTLPGWPAGWSRSTRSNATMVVASAALVLFLWLMAIPLSWAPEPIGPAARDFADGTLITVELTIVSGLAGIAIGLVAAMGKLSRVAPVRWLASFYIWVVRGTPLLVQVLFVYFALPALIPSLRLSDFTSACIALALNIGAYNAEAIRSGLQAVPKGQTEAARSLGMSAWHTFLDIVFPQAMKISLPSLVNNIVSLLKDSSLAYTIGVVELTNVGNRIQAATFQPMATLVTTACIYLVLTTMLTQISDAIEHRYDVEGRRP
ncbi:amino acid ABC transporter permease [uncultured Aquabacterium sp.]|jgi:polar amino acid transport system permease protein|uniref:amino acid ABC transporter permease n=1 Tax=uncultured Aquabacterium sp. TaxID=158753 RepID=UPI00263307FB|nr:amino acid ABC transporter permease [uncultured Aquabacterium sp.]